MATLRLVGGAVLVSVLFVSNTGNGVSTLSPKVSSVAAGQDYTCAVLSDGTVKCWGRNRIGQPGNHTVTFAFIPWTINGVSNATAVASGGSHTCVLLSNSTVKCWGDNEVGELGNGTLGGYSTSPVKAVGISNASAIAAGGGYSCALLSNGMVNCWGGAFGGQLGNGTSKGASPIPIAVNEISNATAISASGWGVHTCALVSDGHVKCWGRNDFGQLGNGTTAKSPVPVLVSGISNATAIVAGTFHTCALLTDGHVKCWGANRFGQLGNGTSTTSPPRGLTTPVSVAGISSVIAIAAGEDHTCALLSDGTLKCWGRNHKGQLGNGTNIGPESCTIIGPYGRPYACSTTPVDVSGISDATAVTAGGTHTCARLSDGHVKCWGNNAFAQLGNRTAGRLSPIPVEVTGLLE
jgi:alpha-tubulin suppressor-like RCC1 family protein